jgi:hypothetical protein
MTPTIWLLAAEHYFFHLRNPLRNVTSQQVWQGSLVLIGVVLAGAIAWWLALRWIRYERKNRHSPWRLFRELCAVHRLNLGERSLLKRLAVDRQLPQPATLFVEPSLWDCHELGHEWQQHADRLRGLRERLFARA